MVLLECELATSPVVECRYGLPDLKHTEVYSADSSLLIIFLLIFFFLFFIIIIYLFIYFFFIYMGCYCPLTQH